jgi:glycine cleavage system H lipoate-binding protein
MRCPFLREAQVKYCQASAIKKMIARSHGDTANERCSSPEYVHCPSLKQYHEEHEAHTRCPFLQESLVQYCAASPATKYVPYSESSITRCGNEAHRFCDVYLTVASPGGHSKGEDSPSVDGIPIPDSLAFTGNHMWLSEAADGICHIGVDAFLTRILSRVDAVDLAAPKGSEHPTALLTVNGVEFQLAFPLSMHVTATNSYLRADPRKLVSHPYSSGWLFEGMLRNGDDESAFAVPPIRLMRGEQAVKWMKQEVQRLTSFVHNQIVPDHFGSEPVMMDGGAVQSCLLECLDKKELVRVYNEFFSPYASWRKDVE